MDKSPHYPLCCDQCFYSWTQGTKWCVSLLCVIDCQWMHHGWGDCCWHHCCLVNLFWRVLHIAGCHKISKTKFWLVVTIRLFVVWYLANFQLFKLPSGVPPKSSPVKLVGFVCTCGLELAIYLFLLFQSLRWSSVLEDLAKQWAFVSICWFIMHQKPKLDRHGANTQTKEREQSPPSKSV